MATKKRDVCRGCFHPVEVHSTRNGCTWGCRCYRSLGEAVQYSEFAISLPRGSVRPGYAPVNQTKPESRAERKEADMTRSAATIQRELRMIEAEEEKLRLRRIALGEEQAARLALPEEPDVDTVIKFRVQHDPTGIVYTYVAFRSRRQGASWHTTSKTRPGPYTWDDILHIMQSDVSVKVGAATLEFFQFDGSGKFVR